jgi:hypothetical protein
VSTNLKDRYKAAKKLIDKGQGVKAACSEVGLAHWQYYGLRQKDPNATIKRVDHKAKPRLMEIPAATTNLSGRLIALMGSPTEVLEAIRSLS